MTCASVELLDAMRGAAPGVTTFTDTYAACGERGSEHVVYAMQFSLRSGTRTEHLDPVTCPACLLLMREAVGL